MAVRAAFAAGSPIGRGTNQGITAVGEFAASPRDAIGAGSARLAHGRTVQALGSRTLEARLIVDRACKVDGVPGASDECRIAVGALAGGQRRVAVEAGGAQPWDVGARAEALGGVEPIRAVRFARRNRGVNLW
jgi:hypothetical protein